MKENAKDSPVSVRFGATVSEQLDQVSTQTGIGKAEIIRRATEEYLARVQNEGRIVIPLIVAEAKGDNNTITVHNGHPGPYKIRRKK